MQGMAENMHSSRTSHTDQPSEQLKTLKKQWETEVRLQKLCSSTNDLGSWTSVGHFQLLNIINSSSGGYSHLWWMRILDLEESSVLSKSLLESLNMPFMS